MSDYSDKLKSPKWQKKRLEILKRDDFKCRLCGDEETTLNIHHKKYNGNPWDAEPDDLMTVCENCHYVLGTIKPYIPDKIVKFKSEDSITLFSACQNVLFFSEISFNCEFIYGCRFE